MPLCCRRVRSVGWRCFGRHPSQSEIDRQMKLLLAVFLLAILTPLVQGSRDFSVDWSGDGVFSAELTETVAQETAACAAENLEMTLQQQLSAGGVPDAQVQVQMHWRTRITEKIGVTVDFTQSRKSTCAACGISGNEVKLYVEEDS